MASGYERYSANLTAFSEGGAFQTLKNTRNRKSSF